MRGGILESEFSSSHSKDGRWTGLGCRGGLCRLGGRQVSKGLEFRLRGVKVKLRSVDYSPK